MLRIIFNKPASPAGCRKTEEAHVGAALAGDIAIFTGPVANAVNGWAQSPNQLFHVAFFQLFHTYDV
jgi:hypothetical protein